MSQVRPDVDAIDRDLTVALRTIREALKPIEDGTPEDAAICAFETFLVVALRIFRSVPPARIRAAARHLEIVARYKGLEVLTLTKAPPP